MGVLGVSLLALAFGIAGLVRTQRNGTSGKGFAITGIILGAIYTASAVFGGLYGYQTWAKWQTVSVDVTGPREVHAQQLATGHCIEDVPASSTVDMVTLVPCNLDHEAEVVLRTSVDGDDWPGQNTVNTEVGEECRALKPEAALEGNLIVWTPTRPSWVVGDHMGLCLELVD